MPEFDPTGAEIRLGPRSWGRRPGCAGVILHTTEYPTNSRADAERCIADQSRRGADGSWLQPGSYNYVLHDAGAFLAVPYLEASGGINPASRYWAPGRFPWLRQLLGTEPYEHPTEWHLQLAFGGQAAALAWALQAGRSYMLETVDRAARIITWAQAQPWAADNLVVSGHMHWQSNRSDPGQQLLDAVVARCAELERPTVPTPAPDYQELYQLELAKVTELTGKLRAERELAARRDAWLAGYPR